MEYGDALATCSASGTHLPASSQFESTGIQRLPARQRCLYPTTLAHPNERQSPKIIHAAANSSAQSRFDKSARNLIGRNVATDGATDSAQYPFQSVPHRLCRREGGQPREWFR